MIGLPDSVRILLFSEPTDMRRGIDGLTGLVLLAGEDVYSGHLFVFVSRKRNRAKILTYQKGGFVLWYNQPSSHYTSFDPRRGSWSWSWLREAWIAAARSLSRSQRLQCLVG